MLPILFVLAVLLAWGLALLKVNWCPARCGCRSARAARPSRSRRSTCGTPRAARSPT